MGMPLGEELHGRPTLHGLPHPELPLPYRRLPPSRPSMSRLNQTRRTITQLSFDLPGELHPLAVSNAAVPGLNERGGGGAHSILLVHASLLM